MQHKTPQRIDDSTSEAPCLDRLKSLVDRQLVEGGAITITATASDYSDGLFRPLLSLQEAEKASRFMRRRDQNMSTVAHGLKRMALTIALGVNVDQLIFSATDKGKPHCNNDQQTRFSLSHARGKVAVTLTSNREVGVDIDFPRSEKYRDIANMVLSPTEREEFRLAQFSSDFFIRRWTQKEAISKASGLGLGADFASFTINDNHQPVICPTTNKVFFVETTPLFGGYVSVACEGGKPENVIVDFDPYLTATRIFEKISPAVDRQSQ